MENKYYLIDADAVSECLKQVVAVKSAIGRGKTNILRECEKAGISRATYYKYKDKIYELPAGLGKKVVFSIDAERKREALTEILLTITQSGGEILSVNQGYPMNKRLKISITVDCERLKNGVGCLVEEINKKEGVKEVTTSVIA